jgi:hypothetical protein
MSPGAVGAGEAERFARARRRGLARAHAVRRRAAGAGEARAGGAATGWHGRPDWRLDALRAHAAASELERHGWRAEAVPLGQGVALVEVRDLAVRGHPLVAVLREPGQAEAWLAAHGHGLLGRVPAAPEGVRTR